MRARKHNIYTVCKSISTLLAGSKNNLEKLVSSQVMLKKKSATTYVRYETFMLYFTRYAGLKPLLGVGQKGPKNGNGPDQRYFS